jgi:hypothetical protein
MLAFDRRYLAEILAESFEHPRDPRVWTRRIFGTFLNPWPPTLSMYLHGPHRLPVAVAQNVHKSGLGSFRENGAWRKSTTSTLPARCLIRSVRSAMIALK